MKSIQSSNTGGAAMAYAYDALNRLAAVTEPNTGTTNYTYDAVGNLQSVTYPNGVAHSYSYDQRNRLANLAVNKVAGTPATATPIASYAYTLDASGHRTSVTELSGRTVNYAYDNLYRLTSESISCGTAIPGCPSGTVNYTYDPVGNRKQMTSTLAPVPAGLFNYDANDRIATDTYDANGNTTASGGLGYAYDFENHLIQKGGLSIVYDGDGNRVSKTIAGVTEKYLVDDLNPTGYAQVVEELQSGAVARSYTWGLELISELFPPNSPLATNHSPLFYIFDGHGSVRALTDATGAVTDTYDYDAFGNLIYQTGSTPNNHLFAGEQWDPDLGLYYNRARYLNTSTGRFWTMDTFEGDAGSPISLHKYLYVGSDPINRTDRNGREFDLGSTVAASGIAGTLSGAIVGGITGGVRGAISGAIQGAIFGTVFPLGGAGVGAALLGNAARGVFLVGVGGLIGSTGVSAYTLATANNSNERNGAIASLVLSAAFIAIGPRVLQTASTRTYQAEQVNATFPANWKPPYAPGTVVTETTIFKPLTLVRVFAAGQTNPVGEWLADPTEVSGFSPDDIQSSLSLPFKPTHVETVTVPAGSTIRVGFANPDAFGGVGYGLQYQWMNRIDPNTFSPGAPF